MKSEEFVGELHVFPKTGDNLIARVELPLITMEMFERLVLKRKDWSPFDMYDVDDSVADQIEGYGLRIDTSKFDYSITMVGSS